MFYEVRGSGEPVTPPHEPVELLFMEPDDAIASGRMATAGDRRAGPCAGGRSIDDARGRAGGERFDEASASQVFGAAFGTV